MWRGKEEKTVKIGEEKITLGVKKKIPKIKREAFT